MRLKEFKHYDKLVSEAHNTIVDKAPDGSLIYLPSNKFKILDYEVASFNNSVLSLEMLATFKEADRFLHQNVILNQKKPNNEVMLRLARINGVSIAAIRAKMLNNNPTKEQIDQLNNIEEYKKRQMFNREQFDR